RGKTSLGGKRGREREKRGAGESERGRKGSGGGRTASERGRKVSDGEEWASSRVLRRFGATLPRRFPDRTRRSRDRASTERIGRTVVEASRVSGRSGLEAATSKAPIVEGSERAPYGSMTILPT